MERRGTFELPRYDVIVAGGGSAGSAAAIASARMGAKTLLIESGGFLGGTVTDACLPTFSPFGNTDKPLIRGIGLEILEKLRKCAPRIPYYHDTPEKPLYSWFPIDSEAAKAVLDEMTSDSGCEVLFHSRVISCNVLEGRIQSLSVQTVAGPLSVRADQFVDCTGDGYLSACAGCEIRVGDEDGEVQAATMCFKIANFDTDRFVRYSRETGEGGNLDIACRRALADGAFPEGETKVSGIAFPSPGVAVLNFGHVFEVDPLDPLSLSKAEKEGRALLPKLLRFLRDYLPGAENAVLVSSGPKLGIRESRRVLGEYVLTQQDYLDRADFSDAIAYYCYPIDIHGAKMHSEKNRQYADTYKNLRYRPGESYGVPFRCLIPKGMRNLLTAGKIISCDHSMQASTRVVPCCFATGQAAGTAAAMAARAGIDAARVDAACLRGQLASDGCNLEKQGAAACRR